jgi:hypothetical protein
MEKHDVHVAERVELAATVTAECDDGERGRGGAFGLLGETHRGVEDVAQKDVDQLNAEGANLAPAPSVLVPQPQPMLLDLEELFVERQRLRRAHRARRGKFTLGVGQDFSEMTRSGHYIFDFRFSNFDWTWKVRFNRKSTIEIRKCSQLDRVALHLVIKRRTLNAEDLRGFLLVAVTLGERLDDGVAL